MADGPRSEEEAKLCEESRKIIETVDWDCEVYKNYADVNLGCRDRVSSGITWAFEQVEEAIILEDDCVPNQSFFYFCQSLLDYYRDDERIMVISGNNFQNGKLRTQYSYYFSRYNHCWGWATWRRAWRLWDRDSNKWLEFKASKLIEQIFIDKYEMIYWENIFDQVFLENKFDSWAYIWTFTCWNQSGLTILPNCNLVSNIGFGKDATHTFQLNENANLITQNLLEISHPTFIVRHEEADQYTFDYYFDGLKIKESNIFLYKLKQKFLSIKQKIKKLISKSGIIILRYITSL